MNKISPCLWFDHQAEDAVRFYTTVFENAKTGKTARYTKASTEVSGREPGSVMTVTLEVDDLEIVALNGGPMFKFTPALSFFVNCSSEDEINEKWKKLSQGGQIRMGIDKYPWAERYGWTSDQFGVEWQLILNPKGKKITPAFLFVDNLFGKGEQAVNFYMSIFPNSKIESMARDEATKSVAHCSFTLNGQGFSLMEGQGTHGFTFSHATSLMVQCETQTELDHYWEKLSEGGTTEQCGWLRDRYGVSWQIVPRIMADLMTNPLTSEKVTKAMLQMKKLDIATLVQAAK